MEQTCPICYKVFSMCNHSLYAMIIEYRNHEKQIKEIVEEAIDVEDEFQDLPWRKVREIHDLVTTHKISGLGLAIRELDDTKREEREE